MCVLATDQQLTDFECFCTGNESSVLSVDPTYNLGLFYVTPTTFRNLTVETRQQSSNTAWPNISAPDKDISAVH